ncbi:MAG: peptidoglycan editing factor PgeF [Desulfitobacteriaceae bacterium]
MAWEWTNGEFSYLHLPAWGPQGVEIGFSSRKGGVSLRPYSSLNLGLHVGDEPEAVLENRERWVVQWQADWEEFAVGEQVHGTEVVWLEEDAGGRGTRDQATAIPGVDGLLTQSSLGLMGFFADCVPLFFYHPQIRAIGLAHAGWKGTVGKIVLQVLAGLAERGGPSADVWVALGPSIGPCCYEVDDRVAQRFKADFRETPFLRATRPGHYTLDLWQANRTILVDAGVPTEQIWTAGVCTSCHPEEFFSHRRDGAPTGRMAAWIRLKAEGF